MVTNNAIRKDLYEGKIKNIEDKIPDITSLTYTASLNVKINEVKGEILMLLTWLLLVP